MTLLFFGELINSLTKTFCKTRGDTLNWYFYGNCSLYAFELRAFTSKLFSRDRLTWLCNVSWSIQRGNLVRKSRQRDAQWVFMIGSLCLALPTLATLPKKNPTWYYPTCFLWWLVASSLSPSVVLGIYFISRDLLEMHKSDGSASFKFSWSLSVYGAESKPKNETFNRRRLRSHIERVISATRRSTRWYAAGSSSRAIRICYARFQSAIQQPNFKSGL